ncbi:MAG: D-alanine--D-alanine ligase, partial [Leptospiraceae bacterium]|nr:D-alanine--D-alanine ligase [Leptospiraceae bacterium]
MTAQSEQSRRIRVGVLFGGRSAEHEISLISARNIIEGFDSQRYEVIPIGIDREGRWRLARDARRMLVDAGKSLPVFSDRTPEDLGLIPGEAEQLAFAHNASGDSPPALDVVFPVLHGPFGEDGSMQGLLKILNLPFVGPGVAGSAVGMDKDLMKRLLRDAGIPIGRFRSVHAHRRAEIIYADVTAELGSPVYVKPANMGSSVGISRVSTADEYAAALDMAFAYDNKIIIEESIIGREIECAVLGNLGKMRASV